ncbi:transmembrane protein 119b [Cololabis saira]|uniref:transmembrane protein 119b n=1 Tax=Cololabis saira TaxID=129043 RepID=UPI002AD512CE|nr:transmembrane protein 119b [Cololabis saira]
MLPVVLRHIHLAVGACFSSSLATPLYSSLEGSTDEEELGNTPSASVSTSIISSTEYQTTPADPVQEETNFLNQLGNFLEENMLLILVATTFVLLVFLIICGAICMSHRRRVNAYYPSSFPFKMYVDHQDKTGGTKPFNEVREKVAPEKEIEAVDSHKQLQADIMRAAKSLRTPNKSADTLERNEPCQKVADHSSEDSFNPDASIVDRQLSSLHEKEECELSDSGAASASSPNLDPPEQQLPREVDIPEASIGKSLRPSSLHIHNDSATLQLIAGEKTAF